MSNLKKPWVKAVLSASLVLVLLSAVLYWRSFSGKASGEPSESVETVPQIYWETLALLDYEKAIVPDELRKLDGKKIEVPGFAVPLEDNANEVSEFLLVPNGMACIHAPPPPPNQMVLVELVTKKDFRDLRGPLWVRGELKVVDTKSKYGAATYEMLGLDVRPYQ